MKQLIQFYLLLSSICSTGQRGFTIFDDQSENSVILDLIESESHFYFILDIGSKENFFMPCLYGDSYLLSLEKINNKIDTLAQLSSITNSLTSLHHLQFNAAGSKITLVGSSKSALQTTPTTIISVAYDIEWGTTSIDTVSQNLQYQLTGFNKLQLQDGSTILAYSLWNGQTGPTDGNYYISIDSFGNIKNTLVTEIDPTTTRYYGGAISSVPMSNDEFYSFSVETIIYNSSLVPIDTLPADITYPPHDRRSAVQCDLDVLISGVPIGFSKLDQDLLEIKNIYGNDQSFTGTQGQSIDKNYLKDIYMVSNRFISGSHRTMSLTKSNCNLDIIWEKEIEVPENYEVIWGHGVLATRDGGAVVYGSVNEDLTESLDAFFLKYDADGVITSRSDAETKSLHAVYPNPSAGMLYVSGGQPGQLLHMVVYSQLGELVQEISESSSGQGTDLSYLPIGIYYIKTTTADGSTSTYRWCRM